MRLGLIVNPIAGLGGPVGLKGTDGAAAAEALRRGAVPEAQIRAERMLAELAPLRKQVRVIAALGAMGADAAIAAGFAIETVPLPCPGATSGADTRAVAAGLAAACVDLLLFVGGDGTARDVLAGAPDGPPVLGAPAGVKMHSGVFATTPRAAGRLAQRFLAAGAPADMLRPAEIVDRPDGATGADGSNQGPPTLYGVLSSPYAAELLQPAKARGGDPDAAVAAACRLLAKTFTDDVATIIGPGSTTAVIKAALGAPGALLGVDVYRGGRLIAGDAERAEVTRVAREGPARIVASPIGGQGFLFGRGNQQIGADALDAVGPKGLVIVASAAKLVALGARPLYVDTGDPAVNGRFAGYRPAHVAPRRTMLVRLADPDMEAG